MTLKKLLIINIGVAVLIFLFIKASINVSEKYSTENIKAQKHNEVHIANK